MDYDEFESDLGNIIISKSHIERENSDSYWIKDRIDKEGKDSIAENINFSEIKDIQYEIGNILKAICINKNGKWKKFYFKSEENAQECLDTLEYRFKAFKQNFD